MAAGFLYILIRQTTGLYLFCPLHRFTGIYCPGCGVTRMFLHMLKWEFKEAFSSNCLLFCLLPFFTVGYIRHTYRYIRFGKKGLSKTENIFCWIVVILLLIFGFVRNLFPLDILVP